MVLQSVGKDAFRAQVSARDHTGLLDQDDVPIVLRHQPVDLMQPAHLSVDIDGDYPQKPTCGEYGGDDFGR